MHRTMYHPEQFTDELDNASCERLGLLFQMPGKQWPSKKITFHLAHMQALNVWHPRMLPRYQGEGRRVVCRLPDWGTVRRTRDEMVRAGFDLLPDVAYDGRPWIIDPITRYGPMLAYRRNLASQFPAPE